MAARRPAAESPKAPPTAASSPSAVHLRRADGLDLEVSGDAAFVTETLEHLLVVLGVVPGPG